MDLSKSIDGYYEPDSTPIDWKDFGKLSVLPGYSKQSCRQGSPWTKRLTRIREEKMFRRVIESPSTSAVPSRLDQWKESHGKLSNLPGFAKKCSINRCFPGALSREESSFQSKCCTKTVLSKKVMASDLCKKRLVNDSKKRLSAVTTSKTKIAETSATTKSVVSQGEKSNPNHCEEGKSKSSDIILTHEPYRRPQRDPCLEWKPRLIVSANSLLTEFENHQKKASAPLDTPAIPSSKREPYYLNNQISFSPATCGINQWKTFNHSGVAGYCSPRTAQFNNNRDYLQPPNLSPYKESTSSTSNSLAFEPRGEMDRITYLEWPNRQLCSRTSASSSLLQDRCVTQSPLSFSSYSRLFIALNDQQSSLHSSSQENSNDEYGSCDWESLNCESNSDISLRETTTVDNFPIIVNSNKKIDNNDIIFSANTRPFCTKISSRERLESHGKGDDNDVFHGGAVTIKELKAELPLPQEIRVIADYEPGFHYSDKSEQLQTKNFDYNLDASSLPCRRLCNETVIRSIQSTQLYDIYDSGKNIEMKGPLRLILPHNGQINGIVSCSVYHDRNQRVDHRQKDPLVNDVFCESKKLRSSVELEKTDGFTYAAPLMKSVTDHSRTSVNQQCVYSDDIKLINADDYYSLTVYSNIPLPVCDGYTYDRTVLSRIPKQISPIKGDSNHCDEEKLSVYQRFQAAKASLMASLANQPTKVNDVQQIVSSTTLVSTAQDYSAKNAIETLHDTGTLNNCANRTPLTVSSPRPNMCRSLQYNFQPSSSSITTGTDPSVGLKSLHLLLTVSINKQLAKTCIATSRLIRRSDGTILGDHGNKPHSGRDRARMSSPGA